MRAPTFASCVGSLLIALLLGASQPACKRKTGPSEHYDRGSAIHQRLYVTLLDDAYLDPRMEEAIKELKQVEATSISHPLALELLGQIDKGSKGAKAAAELRAKSQAEMQRGLLPPSIDPSRFAPPPPPPPAPETPDAGTAAQDPYGPGALIDDINKATGGCLAPAGPFREEGGKVSGVAYRLVALDRCRDQAPGLFGQVVLAVEGRVYRRLPAGEVQDVSKKGADAGTPAGAAVPAAAAPAARPAPPPPFPGARFRTEGPAAFEGQKDAAKQVETPPAKMEESTPK